tara:strand:- start:1544 stop:1888 length:345 start_codon:yes stop_codon:yes gene_type:complete
MLILLCSFLYEVFNKFSLISKAQSIIKRYGMVFFLFNNSDISDEEKEKLIYQNSLKILFESLNILMILVLITAIFLIFVYFNDALLEIALSFNGFLISVFYLFTYHKVKTFFLR